MSSDETNPDASVPDKPSPDKTGTPVLDVFRVKSVREVMGADFAKTIEAFISDLPKILEKLRHTLAQGKLENLGDTAHGLKGGAGNIGAIALAELARQLETAGKSKNIATAQALMTQMEGEMQHAADALCTLIGN